MRGWSWPNAFQNCGLSYHSGCKNGLPPQTGACLWVSRSHLTCLPLWGFPEQLLSREETPGNHPFPLLAERLSRSLPQRQREGRLSLTLFAVLGSGVGSSQKGPRHKPSLSAVWVTHHPLNRGLEKNFISKGSWWERCAEGWGWGHCMQGDRVPACNSHSK